LEKLNVEHVLKPHQALLKESSTIDEVREQILGSKEKQSNYYIVINNEGIFKGIISLSNIMSMQHPVNEKISSLIRRKPYSISISDTLKTAAAMMAKANLDVLPVTNGNNIVTGILTYRDILSAYNYHNEEHEASVSISLRRRALKALLRNKKRSV
jgi:predicted transcriptional regulator